MQGFAGIWSNANLKKNKQSFQFFLNEKEVDEEEKVECIIGSGVAFSILYLDGGHRF